MNCRTAIFLVCLLLLGCGVREQRGALPASPRGLERDEVPMVFVAAGPFFRGVRKILPSKEKDAAVPGRRIYLDAFFIDKFEVTNASYSRFVSDTGRHPPRWSGRGPHWGGDWRRFSWRTRRHPPGAGDLPVTLVSWFDAEAYCAWAAKRLPTEAEWEKAARGTDARTYPWGEEPPGIFANIGKRHEGPLPAGSFPEGASPYGAMDMAGNVSEWVADYYDPAYYARAPERNPPGPNRGSRKVVRGGYWAQSPEMGRTDHRSWGPPAGKHGGVGFRCARSIRSER